MKKIIVFLIGLFIIISCKSLKNTSHSEERMVILNGTYILHSVSTQKDLKKLFPDGMPQLTFEKDENSKNDYHINGYDGCNFIQGKATFKNQELIFDPNFISTMMACDYKGDELLRDFLSKPIVYNYLDDALILKNEQDTWVFQKISLGGKWVLKEQKYSKQKTKALFPYKKPFIVLDIFSQKFVGNTVCKLISGMVHMENNQMKFSNITSSGAFCDDKNEKQYLDQLQKNTHYKLEGKELWLMENDKPKLIFIKEMPNIVP